jgi:hypothetical protein
MTDWRLWIFRIGGAVCLALAIAIGTQFHIISSVSALWSHNLTGEEVTSENLALRTKSTQCLAALKKPKIEYPPPCTYDEVTLHGLPRDVAVRNIAAALVLCGAFAVGIAFLIWQGRIMAREGSPDMPKGSQGQKRRHRLR